MKCIICENEASLFLEQFRGCLYAEKTATTIQIPLNYFERPVFDIFHCNTCSTRFVTPRTPADYEEVYQSDLYKDLIPFSQDLIKVANEDPIWTLIGRSYQYYVVFDYLKRVQNPLKIIDIGCGYGYLVWALRYLGHATVGFEVSDTAVEFAKKTFGDFFYNADKSYLSTKPDIITALEVIEHVEYPLLFIEKCLSMLNEQGTLILSTPNLEYYTISNASRPWATEEPPVHLQLFSRKTFEYIAEKLNLSLEFTEFPGKKNVATLGIILKK